MLVPSSLGIEPWVAPRKVAFVACLRLPFFKNGPTPAFFVYFRFFKHKLYRKKCKLQRDSNSDLGIVRRARCPTTTTASNAIFLIYTLICLPMGKPPKVSGYIWAYHMRPRVWCPSTTSTTIIFELWWEKDEINTRIGECFNLSLSLACSQDFSESNNCRKIHKSIN